MLLSENELGVAEQEPLSGPVTQDLGNPGRGLLLAGGDLVPQPLGLLAVVLQVRIRRELEVAIGHHNLLRHRGPLARSERGW